MILSDKYHEKFRGGNGDIIWGEIYILYTATDPTVYLKGPRAGRPAGRLRAAAGQAPGAGRQAQGQLRTDQSGAGQGICLNVLPDFIMIPIQNIKYLRQLISHFCPQMLLNFSAFFLFSFNLSSSSCFLFFPFSSLFLPFFFPFSSLFLVFSPFW